MNLENVDTERLIDVARIYLAALDVGFCAVAWQEEDTDGDVPLITFSAWDGNRTSLNDVNLALFPNGSICKYNQTQKSIGTTWNGDDEVYLMTRFTFEKGEEMMRMKAKNIGSTAFGERLGEKLGRAFDGVFDNFSVDDASENYYLENLKDPI